MNQKNNLGEPKKFNKDKKLSRKRIIYKTQWWFDYPNE
jgi:hypothetical protein